MNTIPDLIPLHDSRLGIRSLLQVEIREPMREEGTESAENVSQETEGSESQLPVLDFIASTATLDRYQEIIEPGGWRLESYRKNPVFQNAHNYGDILFTLGRALSTEVRDVNGGLALCQRIEFATEVSPIARIAYGLYKGRFLNAVSVGFIPLRWEDGGSSSTGAQSKPGPRRRFIEQELLEVSAVAIPANPDALALGLKSGAIVKSDLEDTVEVLRAALAPKGPLPGRLGETTPPEGRGCFGETTLPGERCGALGSLRTANSALPDQLLDLAREFRRVMRQA